MGAMKIKQHKILKDGDIQYLEMKDSVLVNDNQEFVVILTFQQEPAHLEELAVTLAS